jgi:hypothetical protein
METYDPVLESRALEKSRLGSPRPRPDGGVAHVLYGRHAEPLVLTRGGRLTLGEHLFGGYTTLFVVDLSVRRLARQASLPCRGDAHNFAATLALTCQVVDPKAVVQHNVRDAGAVLWSAVLHQARLVSRDYGMGDTAVAERAIADRLASLSLHPAFATEGVEVQLAPDPQAVEIGRRGADMTVWNTLVENPLAAAHLAAHPDDIQGALDVVQRMHRQFDESVRSFEESHGRLGADLREQRKAILERQARQLGMGPLTGLPTEGVRPVLPPRDDTVYLDEEEDEDA